MLKSVSASSAASAIPMRSAPISREMRFEVPAGVALKSLSVFIFELDHHEQIKFELTLPDLNNVLSFSFDTRTISDANGFVIFGFAEGETEPVVGLCGNSTYLNRVTTLRLERAGDSGEFPNAT